MSTIEFSLRRRYVAWAVALMVLLSAIWVAQVDRAEAGGSPPGTGIAVVYVAVGTNYPDALGVGPGAGGDGAPIIILPTNPPIPGASSAELVRLDPRTLIIIGGTGVISDAMEDALESLLPNAAISRIAGANRYETNAAFSAATFPIEGWASVPAAAFTAGFPASDDVFIFTHATNDTNVNLVAPIQLPHGAEILELKAQLYDASVNGDVAVGLYRVTSNGALSAAASDATSSFSAGDTTLSDTSISASEAIVDNENYAYMIWFEGDPTGGTGVYNVMVRYRLGTSTG
jgi:hypothetical protein